MNSAPNSKKTELRTNGFTFAACLSPVLSVTLGSWSVLAQVPPIVPASDGTNTQIILDGNQFDIHGGQLSGDGANLFHSFEVFGLDTGQVANFQSAPQIENILGRVVGGNPSIVDGLLQVTGGNSNLFLMNPAGMVFGPNASLNVPGDFAATSATGIGFDNGEFAAFGENNWADLVGAPNRLNFAAAAPGAIVNAGDLAVAAGGSLGLFGGTVVNTGTLEAPAGNISVVAVPGENLVRLSAAGNLLSLEVSPAAPLASGFAPLSLPQLLTGGGEVHANSVAVNADGSISLLGSDVAIVPQAGDAIVGGELSVREDSLPTMGESTIQALGSRVAVLGAKIDASGVHGGGNVLIGGEFQGNGTVPNAQYTFVDSQTSIFADALQQGDGGRVILWADETTQFFGTISARGGSLGGNGGFVETSGHNFLDTFGASVDAGTTLGQPGVWLLDPRNVTIQATGSTMGGSFNEGIPKIFTPTEDDAVILVDDILAALNNGTNVTISTGSTGSQEGNITVADPIRTDLGFGDVRLWLNAENDINVEAEITNLSESDRLNLLLLSGGSTYLNAEIDLNRGLIFVESSGAITSETIAANLIDLRAAESLTTGQLNTSSSVEDGGLVRLASVQGDITVLGDIITNSTASDKQGGWVLFNTTEAIDVQGNITTGGGDIRTENDSRPAASITTGNIDTSPTEYDFDGGSIDLFATDNMTIDEIDTSSSHGNGGTVTLSSITGSLDIQGGISTKSEISGDGGNVVLETSGFGQVTVVGNINTSSSSSDRRSGSVDITSQFGNINIEESIRTSSEGTAGNVNLRSESGNIKLGYIRAFGNYGGQVNIETPVGIFKATQSSNFTVFEPLELPLEELDIVVVGEVPETLDYYGNSSIVASDSIEITHGGQSFTVGSDLAENTSGTVGHITLVDGTNASLAGSFRDKLSRI